MSSGKSQESSSGSGQRLKAARLSIDMSSVRAHYEEEVERSGSSPSGGLVHLLEENHDLSDSPENSGPRGEIVEYKKTLKLAIENPDDEQCWNDVLAIPEDQMRILATSVTPDTGFTALHAAAEYGVLRLVQHLLMHGAQGFVDYLGRGPGDQQDYSPLTYAVEFRSIETIDLLLPYSQHKADALCAAIRLYEEETNPIIRAERLEILKHLFSRPDIVGSEFVKNYDRSQEAIPGCINLPEQPTSLRALQLICYYRDLEFFEMCIACLPDPDGEEPEQYQLTADLNTILHLAVLYADINSDNDAAFVSRLLDLYPELSSWHNEENQTALSIAAMKGNIKLITTLSEHKSGVKLWPKVGANQAKYPSKCFSPLHVAVRDGKIDALKLLLEKWPAEANEMLQDSAQSESLIKLAMDAWRQKILNNEKDTTDQVNILKVLLNFDSGGRILDRQLKAASNAIRQIKDPAIEAPLLAMCSQVDSDYRLICFESSDSALNQKIKCLGLANAMQQVAKSYSPKESLRSEAKEVAKTDFIKCCRILLFTNSMKTYFGIAVCALIGFAVGALIGFIVGTLLSGAGPGGFVLGPPSAEYGLLLGTILGGVIFGIGAGTSRYLLSDFFKWQRGLWASSSAMDKNIKNTRPLASSPSARLVEVSNVERKSTHDFAGDSTEDNSLKVRVF